MQDLSQLKRFNIFRFLEPAWHFDNVSDSLDICLTYQLEGAEETIQFEEHLTFPVEAGQWASVSKPALEKAVAALSVMGGISYYKTYLPPRMEGLPLNQEQAEFWTKVYERGLGEFFYRNEIDFRGIINFPVNSQDGGTDQDDSGLPARAAEATAGDGGETTPAKSLVAIGGGKDSLVTAELLKAAGVEFDLFSLRDAAPIAVTARLVGKPRIVVGRTIDPKLFELNEAGALNGHVPITAFISFVTVVCSVLYGYRNLIFSLEKSANYGQVLFHGMDVNHQYSKSEQFEADFRHYLQKNIVPDIQYFSLLRPLNELKIAQIFASLPRFDDFSFQFTSCNTNFKIHREKGQTLWCGNCPKCAFVYLILAPFVERDKLAKVFGQNLLNREDLLPLYEELLGLRNFKPFECVGTPEESRSALYLIAKKPEFDSDCLVKAFKNQYNFHWKDLDWEREVESILAVQNRAFLPDYFWNIIKSYSLDGKTALAEK